MTTFLESERALIGALLQGTKDTQEQTCTELVYTDFYDVANQRLYKAIQSILDDSLEVTPISAKERSRVNQSALDACLLAGQGIAPSNLKTFISDIRNAATLRNVSRALNEGINECNAGSQVEKVLSELETKLYGKIGQGLLSQGKDSATTAKHVLNMLHSRMEGSSGPEISTGLALLDKAIIGLKHKLYIIGARPSMGKSALAETVAINVLGQSNCGVLVFSAEMDATELVERALSSISGVNVRKIQTGQNLSADEVQRIHNAAEHLKPDKMFIIDKTISVSTMRRIARIEKARMARKGINLVLVIVDYAQLFADGEHREQAVSAVSRGCKLMSSELEVSVWALSQLNRSLEHREDKKPMMSDLRESGALEQDADVVIFVYRGHQYNQSIPESDTDLIIAKQRGGPTGSIKVHFNPKLTLFTDVPRPLSPIYSGNKEELHIQRITTQNNSVPIVTERLF